MKGKFQTILGEPLPKSFYARDTKLVAMNLLGKVLVHQTDDGLVKGRIVETEAYYGPGDPASHAFRGKTKRSAIMWGEPGTAYVYFTYGMHYILNVVTEEEGKAGAVLIRALEPIQGIEVMRKRRGVNNVIELCNGPAKLTQAFGINGRYNGADLTSGNLIIEEGDEKKFDIVSTGRIGIKKGREEKLRFYIRGCEFVSKKEEKDAKRDKN